MIKREDIEDAYIHEEGLSVPEVAMIMATMDRMVAAVHALDETDELNNMRKKMKQQYKTSLSPEKLMDRNQIFFKIMEKIKNEDTQKQGQRMTDEERLQKLKWMRGKTAIQGCSEKFAYEVMRPGGVPGYFSATQEVEHIRSHLQGVVYNTILTPTDSAHYQRMMEV